MLFKKLKVSTVFLSVVILLVVSIMFIEFETDGYNKKKIEVDKFLSQIKSPEDVTAGWLRGSFLEGKSVLPVKYFFKKALQRTDFGNHSIRYFPSSKNFVNILDNWQRKYLIKEVSNRHATSEEAKTYFREYWRIFIPFHPFPLMHYFGKALLILFVSLIPTILGFFSSVVTFPVMNFAVGGLVLLMFVVQARSQDNMAEFGLNTTGGKNDLSLFLLHMNGKFTQGVFIMEKGVWGWVGPMWQTKNGVIFAPIGVTLAEGKNGIQVEHISFLGVAMFKFGKWTPMIMGFYNQSIRNDVSSFAWAKTILYYKLFSEIDVGFRADHNFWKEQKWKRSLSLSPVLKFTQRISEKFITVFQISFTINKPHELKLQLEFDF